MGIIKERFAQLLYEDDIKALPDSLYHNPKSYKDLPKEEAALYEEEAQFYMSELNPDEWPDCVLDALEKV